MLLPFFCLSEKEGKNRYKDCVQIKYLVEQEPVNQKFPWEENDNLTESNLLV